MKNISLFVHGRMISLYLVPLYVSCTPNLVLHVVRIRHPFIREHYDPLVARRLWLSMLFREQCVQNTIRCIHSVVLALLLRSSTCMGQ